MGVTDDLATHDIDLTSWITVQPYTSVTARTAHPDGHTPEDIVTILAQLANGVIAHHTASWAHPQPRRSMTITGSHGVLELDLMTKRCATIRPTIKVDTTRRSTAGSPSPMRASASPIRDSGDQQSIVDLDRI